MTLWAKAWRLISSGRPLFRVWMLIQGSKVNKKNTRFNFQRNFLSAQLETEKQNELCARLWIKKFRFEPWQDLMSYVL